MRQKTSREHGAAADSTSRSRLLRGVVFGVAASLSLATPLSAMAAVHAPTAKNDFITLPNHQTDTPWDLALKNDSDLDGGKLTPVIVADTKHGTIKSQGQVFQYDPMANYTGTDFFTYRVQDPEGNLSNIATVSLTVIANRAPVAAGNSYSLISDTILNISANEGVLNNDKDADGDVIHVFDTNAITTAHGIVTPNGNGNGGFSYQPTAGFVGKDQFTYKAADDFNGTSAPALVTMAVTPVVDAVTITRVPNGRAGTRVRLGAKITSPSTVKAGAPLDVEIDGVKVASGVTDIYGVLVIDVLLPIKVGTFALKVSSGTAIKATGSVVIKPGFPAVSSIVLGVPAGSPGQGVYLVSRITSSNPFKADAPVTAYLDDRKVTTRLTDATGTARIPVKLPYLAGKHKIKVVSGTKSATKYFTYGRAVTAKLNSLKTVRAGRTETISGSFGYRSGRVTLKITNPVGNTVTKTVSLSSTGKFSYKYTTNRKGTYTVRYYYVANTKYYGYKAYKLTFKAN